MTWLLVDERSIDRSITTNLADITAWLDWFFLDYLATRGYTVTKGTVGSDIYYGTRQSWVTAIGTVMQTSQVHEFEIASQDVNVYMWDMNETDPTAGLTSKTSNNSAPIFTHSGVFDMQVWESDLDSNSFLVRRKGVASGSTTGSNMYAFSLPFTGANNDTLTDTYYWEGWFASQILPTGARTIVGTGRYGNTTGFITNVVNFSGTVNYHAANATHAYISTDMFTKYNRGSNSSKDATTMFNNTSSCEAVQVGDDFYIDLDATNDISLLIKTGSVNPNA